MTNLYNEKEKTEFLSTIENEYSRYLFSILFEKSKSAEELYEKDLYSFNLDQIDLVMRNINPSTLNSVTNNKSRINSYIRWAIQKGRRENNLNPLQGTGNDWAEKFIDRNTKRYLSYAELHDLIEDFYNAQDQALVQCIFEGISGYKLSELTSLNIKNVKWQENKVRVKDSKTGEYREVKVSDRCLELIEKAYLQTTYMSEKTESESELVEHLDHVFKNTKWKRTVNQYVSHSNLLRRLNTIREKYELDEFNATVIGQSGAIKMAADIIKERGKLEKEEFVEIGEQYALPKVRMAGYEYYNTSAMKKYISEENLKDLYGIEINL